MMMDPNGKCTFLLGFIGLNWFKINDCGSPSCKTSRNYGASEDFIECSDEDVKCYGYAMKYVYAKANVSCNVYDKTIIGQYALEAHGLHTYDLDFVTEHMANAIRNSDLNVMVNQTYDIGEANESDLVIAVRVTDGGLVDDYHFAIRLKDNTWADKKGSNTAFVGEIKSGDEGWPSRYKSKTKYIIVTYLGE